MESEYSRNRMIPAVFFSFLVFSSTIMLIQAYRNLQIPDLFMHNLILLLNCNYAAAVNINDRTAE